MPVCEKIPLNKDCFHLKTCNYQHSFWLVFVLGLHLTEMTKCGSCGVFTAVKLLLVLVLIVSVIFAGCTWLPNQQELLLIIV